MTELLGPFGSFGDLAEAAKDRCAAAPVLNLTLSLKTHLPLSDDAFLETYAEDAELWQGKDAPSRLFFTHGQYMHRHGDAFDYLISQLKSKPTGNRACISLLDTGDLIGSGDDPVPSFLILQAGFDSASHEVLYLTAYYRALEVGSFLPINLAEMALVAGRISRRIPEARHLDLTIHAFRAHLIHGFRPLEHSDLDSASVDAIRTAVASSDYPVVIAWLADKDRAETIIDTTGTATLLTELISAVWASTELISSMEETVSAMAMLQEARRNGSHAATLDLLQDRVSRGLQSSIKEVRQIQQSGGGAHGA